MVRNAQRGDRLRQHGQHLKRGVLLYDPPGTGKTHTVRYLMSRMTGTTVLLLSGRALAIMPAAATALGELSPALTDQHGSLLPRIDQLRDAAVHIASAVAVRSGVAPQASDDQLAARVAAAQWTPEYEG